MTGTQKPFVIVFLGSIGSGKSYFARQLADKLGIVRFNSDAMRKAMGEEWGIEANLRLWGALDYSIEQTLRAGYSVIYDAARMNKLDARVGIDELARKVDARVIVVWIDTPREIAAERAEKRQPMDDQLPFTRSQVDEIIAVHEQGFGSPQPHENVIKISGLISFEEQYEVFQEKFKEIMKSE